MNSKLLHLNRQPQTATHHPRWCAGLCMLLALVLAACEPAKEVTGEAGSAGEEAKPASVKSSGPADLTGVYNLVSVDGKKVPCAVTHEGQSMKINSGSLAVNRDGTCVSKILIEGSDAIEVKANYTQEGQKLTMKWEDAGTTVGTVTGNSLAMTNEGMQLVYRK